MAVSEAEVMAMVKTAVAASVAGLRAVVVEMEEKVAGVREVEAAEEYLEEGSWVEVVKVKEGKVASVRVVVRVEVAKAKEVMAAAAAVVWATVEAAKVEEVKAVVAAERLVAEVVQAKAGVVAMVPVTVGAKWAVVEEAAEEVIAAVKKELVEMVVGEWVEEKVDAGSLAMERVAVAKVEEEAVEDVEGLQAREAESTVVEVKALGCARHSRCNLHHTSTLHNCCWDHHRRTGCHY